MTVSLQLAHLLDEAVAQCPDKLAIVDEKGHLSFRELQMLAKQLATAFADAGLAGQQVAALLLNSSELIIYYLACWMAGVIAVPFEYVDAPPEIRYGLVDSQARWFIVHEEQLFKLDSIDLSQTSIETIFVVGKPHTHQRNFAELFHVTPRQLPDPAPETIAFILYTSGSTALPKGVTHSHATAAGIIQSVLDALRVVDDHSLINVHDSVSHMGGWIEVFPFLWRKATVILEKEFEPQLFYDNLRRWRPAVIGAHVENLWQMVRHPGAQRADYASLQVIFTGGEELPLPLQRAFIDLTGKPIQVGWGMTEAIWLTIAREPELNRPGFMGQPVENVKLRVVNPRDGSDMPDNQVGEFWVQGPMVSPGYWRRPEADREVFVEGWLRTGDMGLRDSQGNFWFTGRLKQIIERHGENITPGEIEQALYRHPAVAEACAFGIPDPDAGQVPVAYVHFKTGQSATEGELKEFLKTQIAEYKIPVQILAIDQMPLTPSGKINRKALTERYMQRKDSR
jgi:long-chain acyl-CoA synthetase